MNTVLLEEINRRCEASVGYGADPVERVSTGFQGLDQATGGGIPRGRIVEIFGSEDSGKTALALHLARQTGGPVLYADADRGLTPGRGYGMYLLRLESMEDTLNAANTAIRCGGFNAVVVDTVAAMPTREELEEGQDLYVPRRSRQAQLMSHWLPAICGPLSETGCTLFLVNQMRTKPTVIYGDPDYCPAGRAVAYYASLRLMTSRTEIIKQPAIGQKLKVRVTKNNTAPPGKEAWLRLIYEKGLIE